MKQQFNELITKELSRKEFLTFVGGGVIALLGMNNFIAYLTKFRASTPAKPLETSHGFGSRKFGG